ncbi:MAG: hypothetical protein U0163_00055 [Gemmatimonadaceae bacterium]
MKIEANPERCTLFDRYIEEDLRRPGPMDANLNTGDAYIQVWALVAYWLSNGRDIDRLAEGYEIPREAAEVAIAYYLEHQAEIDARIERNERALRA